MSPETPRATYRLQLRPEFGFAEATAVVPYMAALGVSHVYTSPVFEAELGSEHGYDVVDYTRVRDELGGDAGLRRFVDALRAHGLRWLVDIVPNHMSVSSHRNAWWWDVLRRGPASPHAAVFDVDWQGDPPHVVLPILGRELPDVLAHDELALGSGPTGEPVLRYFDRLLPLADGTATPTTLSDLTALLARQHYRLIHWRRGATERNYRCFFDISGLAGVRMEQPEVFEATHALVRTWLHDGLVDGLRVDHVDGLADPLEYLRRLRDLAPAAWIVVEKILSGDESLRSGWPVDGTTGYEFARVANALFVDPAGSRPLTELYRSFTAQHGTWTEMQRDGKREVVNSGLATDVARVGRHLAALATEVLPWLGFGEEQATAVVDQALTAFDVYRTYARPGEEPELEDLRRIDTAIRRIRSVAGLEPELIDLLDNALAGRIDAEDAAELVVRFQQLTGPVTAKGVEDTALYRYHRLVALNQVGGEPHRFGVPVWELHRLNAEVARSKPLTMLTASTHDSKRSHDIRARLSLLPECAEAWELAVRRWAAHNERHRVGAVPDRNTEYLVYQTLVGAWPLDEERATDYFRKAAREAGVDTSWLEPDTAYEDALSGFVASVLADETFVSDLEAFVATLVGPGRVASLAQTMLRLCSPGVPDLYQGDELWNLSLVDPDNRRPVDFELRRALLAAAGRLGAAQAWAQADSGISKLWLTQRVLRFRTARPEVFGPGASYLALYARGRHADHVVSFVRGGKAIAVVPRLVLAVADGWDDTTLLLPPGEWTDGLGGAGSWSGRVPVAALFDEFPVALLTAP